MKRWLFLAGAIVLEVTGTLSMKGALSFPALYILMAAAYIGAFLCLNLVLRSGMALGATYGIWAATGVALTAIFSAFIFHEPFTVLMSAGIVLIIGGVLCVELGSQKARTRQSEGL